MANGTDIAKAYVQIIPSAEGIKGKLEEIMGDEADSAGKKSGGKFGQAFGNVLKTAGKIGAAALGAAATGIGALTKSAVEGYAAYEQLVGGVETLFGAGGATLQEFAASIGKTAEGAMDEYGRMMTAQNTVLRNASDAFKTAGLSTNEYMETVTSFSASLISSLEGDTLAAANAADLAIRDMSDNANKMGTDMASIQAAYQGFAKGQYQLLDNLKIGYGGTKTEMERLLQDATALSGIEYDIENLADVYSAIHVIQDELGITGTTAKEASTTISGSIGMMKGAWANLVAGFGDGNADMEKLFGDLVSSAETVLGNLLPVAEQAFGGIADAVGRLAPVIAERIPGLVADVVPPLIVAAGDLTMAFAKGLIENLPTITKTGLEVLVSLAQGIAENLPTLIPTIVDVVTQIVDTLTQPDTLSALIDASIAIMLALADGLIDAIPRLIEAIPDIIENLVLAITSNGPKMVETGLRLVLKLAEGIIKSVAQLAAAAPQLIVALVNGIVNQFKALLDTGARIVTSVKDGFMQKIQDAKNWGRDLIQNFINGLLEKWNNLKQTISNIAQTIKNFLGFSEPEEGPLSDFHTYAPDMMELFAKGIRDNEQVVKAQLAKSFDFGSFIEPVTIPVNPAYSGRYGAFGGYGPAYNYGGVTIVIEGRDKDAAQLARELQTELTRRTAGFDPWRQPA